MVGGLGQAEIDDLRCRLAVLQRHQHVTGLQVAVHHALEMRVLHSRADLLQQLDALLEVELVLVAVVGQRDALDVFHGEEGLALWGQPGVVDRGDAGVLHHRQCLALGLEARHHGQAVHAQLDHLERHTPAHGSSLLGQVDLAHAAFAQRVEDLVRADLSGGGGGVRRGGVWRGVVWRGVLLSGVLAAGWIAIGWLTVGGRARPVARGRAVPQPRVFVGDSLLVPGPAPSVVFETARLCAAGILGIQLQEFVDDRRLGALATDSRDALSDRLGLLGVGLAQLPEQGGAMLFGTVEDAQDRGFEVGGGHGGVRRAGGTGRQAE